MRGWNKDAWKTTKRGGAAANLQLTGFLVSCFYNIVSEKAPSTCDNEKNECRDLLINENMYIWLSFPEFSPCLYMSVHACVEKQYAKRCLRNRSAPWKSTHLPSPLERHLSHSGTYTSNQPSHFDLSHSQKTAFYTQKRTIQQQHAIYTVQSTNTSTQTQRHIH